MSLFRKSSSDDRPIAYHIQYDGLGVYSKAFSSSGVGIVFEDDGETGYLYATNEAHDHIYDALHIYDRSDNEALQVGQDVFVVWSPCLCKAGMYYSDRFHAVIDFKQKRACCRNGFPEPLTDWCTSSHEWDEESIRGLEPA